MKRENEQATEEERERPRGGAVGFLTDVLRGVAIGAAFIIPGFSGGSVAAILGVYEKIVGAIADIFRTFKKSFLTLLPVALGMIVGAGALLFPLGWAIGNYPIPTVSLFAGLALGGLPSVTEKIKGKPSAKNVAVLVVPLLFSASLSFLPLAGDVDLFSLDFGGYLLLVAVGAVGAAALVVPGISGSMLLLIFGYYNPLLQLITNYLLKGDRLGACFAVLVCVCAGLVVGFVGISAVMKHLLKKFPRATYFAILGFILGSLPTVFVSSAKEAGLTLSALPASPWYWIVSVLLLAAGAAASYSLVRYARRAGAKKAT